MAETFDDLLHKLQHVVGGELRAALGRLTTELRLVGARENQKRHGVAGIAYGLSRYSRIAAVAGFALFVLEKIYMLVTTKSVFSVGILGVIIALGFWNSIRGAFAYAKLGGAPTEGGFGAMLSGKAAPSPGARPLQM